MNWLRLQRPTGKRVKYHFYGCFREARRHWDTPWSSPLGNSNYHRCWSLPAHCSWWLHRWSESDLFSSGTLDISTTARWIQSLPRTRKRNGVDFWMLKYTPSCHRVLQFAQNPTSEIHWIVWENFKLIWRERLSSMPGNIDGSGLGADQLTTALAVCTMCHCPGYF